jgi:hypothetical protein
MNENALAWRLYVSQVESRLERGSQLTLQGPPPLPESGSVLSEPYMLWCEDVWTPEREQEAEEK